MQDPKTVSSDSPEAMARLGDSQWIQERYKHVERERSDW